MGLLYSANVPLYLLPFASTPRTYPPTGGNAAVWQSCSFHNKLVTCSDESFEPFSCVTFAAVESVWSGVVSGTQPAVLPAYQPLFPPVPLLHSTSNVDIVRPSTPSSKHVQQGSPASSSSHLSAEAVSRERGGTGNTCDVQHSSPSTASTLRREESTDSGGVFLTPPACRHAELRLESESSAICCNSDLPATSLANVGRRFRRLSDVSDVEYNGKDLATGFVHQNSSSSNLQTDTVETSTHKYSADDCPDLVHVRCSSCQSVLHHRCDEPFIAPSKTKKKTKKSRRNSQPVQPSCSSARSITVYGGNPKWIWKNWTFLASTAWRNGQVVEHPTCDCDIVNWNLGLSCFAPCLTEPSSSLASVNE